MATILITGGNSGIGLATAFEFADHGIDVILCGRRHEATAAAAAAVRARGVRAIGIAADIADPAGTRHLFDTIADETTTLDYAFNCAGIEQVMGPYDTASVDDYERIFATNVRGTWACMCGEVTAMLRSGGGSIVNAGSVSGTIAFAGIPLYVASKHAVHGLTKSFALELAKSSIRVNAIAPGGVDTTMLDRISGSDRDMQDAFAASHPLGRLGRPQEIARAVRWLCLEATWSTGTILTIDGGYTSQ